MAAMSNMLYDLKIRRKNQEKVANLLRKNNVDYLTPLLQGKEVRLPNGQYITFEMWVYGRLKDIERLLKIKKVRTKGH